WISGFISEWLDQQRSTLALIYVSRCPNRHSARVVAWYAKIRNLESIRQSRSLHYSVESYCRADSAWQHCLASFLYRKSRSPAYLGTRPEPASAINNGFW